MRPGSRGSISGGLQPPGSGMRMPTGQRLGRPMSGRMRTGQVTAGPSREAAHGTALSQEVKIADRPVTQQDEKLDELMEETIEPRQRSASLEQDARQPCLGIEADVTSEKKTRNRTEGAAAAERVISGDNSSPQVDTDPIRLTSFGDNFTGPRAFPCSRDDVVVDNGAAAPKPFLSPVEMCTRTAAGGLLPAGLYSNEKRLLPVASSVLTDRGDEF